MKIMSRNFPDFFIAGAPKCGTTSLYEWLRSHPELHMPVKEPGFFSQDLRPIHYNDVQTYQDLFRNCPAEKSLIGEATPRYMYSARGLKEIYKYNPKAKIIILLRNPADLVVSFHGQMLREGIEVLTDFKEAWDLSQSRVRGENLPKLCQCPKVLDYPFWGRIGSPLKTVFDIFPGDQVKVYTLDELKVRPADVYRDVLNFLEVIDDGRSDFPSENLRVEVRSAKLHRTLLSIRNSCAPLLNTIQSLSGGHGTGLLKLVNIFNVEKPRHLTNSPDRFRQELLAFFIPEVEIVESLTGFDLSNWKTLD